MFDYKCNMVDISYGAILCAASFITCFRGIPLDVVEVKYGNKSSDVLFDKTNKCISINVQKCKQLFEKTFVFSENIKKQVHISSINYCNLTAINLFCEDVDLFSLSRLRELVQGEEMADISIAYSISNGRVKLKSCLFNTFPDEHLISAISVYYSIDRNTSTFFEHGDTKIKISPSHNGILLTVPIPHLMRFDTPYI